VQKGPSLVVMQLQENFPRRRIGENFEQAGLETLISEDDFDVYSDGKAAQVVNDEILATIWHSRANKEPNSYIDEIKTYEENYGQNSLTPEIEELANDLDGEDFLTMHFEDSEKYMPIARESVQPEGAVMRGNMGEGVETAWIYENPTLAEAAAEYVRDKPDGANYENQATQKSNIMIASGNEEVIENSLNGSTRITAIGVPHI